MTPLSVLASHPALLQSAINGKATPPCTKKNKKNKREERKEGCWFGCEPDSGAVPIDDACFSLLFFSIEGFKKSKFTKNKKFFFYGQEEEGRGLTPAPSLPSFTPLE
jgi:hypothetical protein